MSSRIHWILAVPVLAAGPLAAEEGSAKSSYSPVVITETFEAVMARMKAAKAEIQKKQKDLLEARYDLSDKGSRTESFGPLLPRSRPGRRPNGGAAATCSPTRAGTRA